MPTTIDVIDSAVKIGLGALIGIIGSITAARQQHSLELKKEALRRRQDALERIAEEFEGVQKTYVDLMSSFLAFIQNPEQPKAERHRDQVHTVMTTEILPATWTLLSIEGRFRLFGLPDCATVTEEYRAKVNRSQREVTLKPPFPSADAVLKDAQEFGQLRLKLYDLIAKAHRGSPSAV